MRRYLLLLAVAVLGAGALVAWNRHQGTAPKVPSASSTSTSSTLSTTPTTSTTSTTSASPTTAATPLPLTVTIAAVGDSELGNTPLLPSNASNYFAPVTRALAAPIVFGNLEGTMTNATTSKCGVSSTDCYAFKVPPSYARIYREAGFTVLNAANNHSYDFGDEGARATTIALRDAGIAQAGLVGEIAVVREGTLKVAFVDFAPYSNTNNLLNFPVAAQLIARARSLANVVVVYMHAGAEGANADHVTRATESFAGENRGNPFVFAHFAIDHGADLVLASGPHVLRGMEFYHGHLIDYSLGDFANYDDFSLAGDLDMSGILRVTLSASGSFVAAHFTSVVLRDGGRAFVDPTGASARFVNALSRDDFRSSAALIERDGSIRAL